MPKISVIIPVFNAEKFIERCLDSVLFQTLADIEIICIDDCSSDNSFNILKEYEVKNDRLKCYKNEQNIGQGLTRNRGIDVAQGEYIAFVDSDDWIESDMYQSLYEVSVLKKYDLICCNLIYDFPDGSSEAPRMPLLELIDSNFMINEGIAPSIKLFSSNSPCDKIYKREYIEKLKLRFVSERVFLYEDKLFNLTIFASNPTFFFVQKSFYHYMIRYGSTMTSYKKDFTEKYFVMHNKIKKLLSENNIMSDEVEQRFKISLFEITFTFCLNSLVYNQSLKGKFLEFSKIINDKRISSNIKEFSVKDIPLSSSKINKLVKLFCFLILKYLK
ncbi:glycosyltransferase family 2 protein [Flavobacterium sp. PS2]|uniref:glycosyltransferase family 2 protein n=1 Tax=Flavobacterium sp. PS2 TaxID=3384157 RepID=UPI00390CA4FD